MNREQLIQEISRQNNLSIEDSKKIYYSIEHIIIEALKQDKKISLRGFLIFETKISKKRESINPATKKKILIPSKKSVRIKISKNLREILNS